MDIPFADIFSTCQELSEFEGRRIKNASGESIYSEVLITEQDEALVSHLAADAAYLLEARILSIDSSEIDPGTHDITITFAEDAQLKTASEDEVLHVIASYVLWKWLEDKDETRHKAYELIFTTALNALRGSIRRKRPTLR